jgi:hypothetical protein
MVLESSSPLKGKSHFLSVEARMRMKKYHELLPKKLVAEYGMYELPPVK